MRKQASRAIVEENAPLGVVPPPELLEKFAVYGPELPLSVMKLWSLAHQRSYRYAMLGLAIGGVLGLGLIGGFVYLVMQGHGGYATTLLGTGALSMVAGFRVVRL